VRPAADRITAWLALKFPNNRIAPTHYGELLIEYSLSPLRPPHLVEELETGDDGKFWSSVWEAMLYRHFVSLGLQVANNSRPSGQHGPDFSIEWNGKTIWVEAVVPGPQGIPADYLEPPGREIRVRNKPDQERVLRCTSAIADKKAKFDEYRGKGIVGAEDITVIALNICRLSDWDVDGNGISQLPLSLEAVFPVGPLAVAITPQGTLADQAQHVARFAVRKPSGVSIETANFLNRDFATISAVLQGHQKDLYQKPLVLGTVHNPLAANPLPPGLFKPFKEFVAKEDGDNFTLRDAVHREDR
jgi:hypothetical protein